MTFLKTYSQPIKILGAEYLRVEFDRRCSTEKRHDPLTIMDSAGRAISVRSGREWSDWSAELRISGDELMWKFYSDGSVNGWGWRFTVYPIMPKSTAIELLSDRAILSKPSVEPVRCIISQRVGCYAEKKLVSRLASALAACAELSSLGKFIVLIYRNFLLNVDLVCMIYFPFVIFTLIS
jgi:E3 ubiquitin-protein ligase HERC2